jgi:hypothetical protein
MHDKITVWTRLWSKWGHMDRRTDMSFSHDTLSWCGRHLCHAIFKSFHTWQSYSPTIMCLFKLFSREWVPSNYKCDLDIEGRDMGLSRHISSWCGGHLCQVILKSFYTWQSYNPDMNVCAYNSYCDKVKCDLDLWGRDVIIRCNTSSLCGWHWCQVILKSFNVWQSYSLYMIVCTY